MPARPARGARSARGGRGRGGAAAASQAKRTETEDNGASAQAASQSETAATQSTVAAASSARSATPQTVSTSATPRGTTPATRGGAASRGVGAGKFLPKGVRRTQAERDAMAQQELKKQSDKAAEDARAKARANRFRGRRARGGRGDAMGVRLARGGGGIFEAPAYQPGQKQHIYDGSRGSGSGGGGRGFKADPTSRAQSIYSSSSRVQGRRVNADMLAPVVDLTEDVKDEDGEDRNVVMPMGMLRLQHKEPEIVVATTAELEAAEQANEDDTSSDDVYMGTVEKGEIVDDKQVWPGAPVNRKVKIEGEDGTLEEITEIDTLADRKAALAPESPEQKKKQDVIRERESAASVKKRKTAKDPEEAEAAEDLAVLLDQFGIKSMDDAHESEDTDMDGSPATDLSAAQKKLEGHMYMFQFPPVLPPLLSHAKPKPGGPVKEEPNDDTVIMDALANGAESAIDLTGDQSNVKQEDGAEGGASGDAQNPSAADLYGQGGFLGKLVVRKSGKVELSWGGRTLEMAPGQATQFLTTAIITEEFDQKPRPGEIAGKSYGMGQIYGKFVLAPTWEEEAEWVVDPAELP
ncbi:hypothetical protein NKR23_g10006 [Pleurostoma richardsiae]|uniref:Uncharacterized protein n=1 Tax=Pleurostoma richardsiae TaxID=41990 RepID=A0AA38VM85_9PEZI|nr:hypothetical protein NKR23_g10006 [Pleurostoma richardsiae]